MAEHAFGLFLCLCLYNRLMLPGLHRSYTLKMNTFLNLTLTAPPAASPVLSGKETLQKLPFPSGKSQHPTGKYEIFRETRK
ncbi:hypothetical protein A4R26_08670 [Niastella populi]|uniref:Uncharacterized protein n=1 Tax=Niastella populi TaxID=550983 RepID=A0A1V9EL49_9BACT|nr:hypothetical protein A4R26_08670 [Niastella populi]